MADYLQALSPQDLINRYAYISDHNTAKVDIYNDTDQANLFAFQLARQTLGRMPTPGEIVSGPGVITASNVASILAASQAPPTSTIDASGGIPAPGTSSPGSMTFDSAGPGGTPLSFASQYSFGGSAPAVFAAPSSVGQPGGGSSFLLVLIGAVIFFFAFK